ncbi:MAG: hypothetical protein N2045_14105, partial [Fimbriimonadales bacterium]|nr:hypothetical protein [Fimbriimonadales bacterium]
MANLTYLSLDDPVDASVTVINANFAALNTDLDGKAAASHTHSASDIVSGVIAAARLGTGTPSVSTFLRGDGQWAAVSWADVAGKPSTFPPATHTHNAGDITSGVIAVARLGSGSPSSTNFLRGDGQWATVSWADVAGKPTTFTPSAHTHPPSDIQQAGASTGQALVWNGSQWAPGTISGANSPTPLTAVSSSTTLASNTRYRVTANNLTL